jgi:hypothetical protein
MGADLYGSGAPFPLGTVRERVDRRPTRVGGAAGRELEPIVLSCPASSSRRDDDTSAPRGGDDEDGPDMLLQSIAALATSPLHDGSGDGSSSEERPTPPPSASCCGRCDRAWRSGVSYAAPYAQRASSLPQPGSG